MTEMRLNVSNWDDWVYFGGHEERKEERRVFLKFCLNCGENQTIPGPRFKVVGAIGKALLVEASWGLECKICKHPLFTSAHYKQLTKRTYFN